MPKKVSKSYHKNVNAKDIRIWKKWQKRTKVFALVALVLAGGVGGYAAYKGFAVSGPTSTYTVANGYLQAGANSSVLADTGAGKTKTPGQSVVVVQPGGTAYVGSLPGQYIQIPARQKFQLCVDEKGSDLDANNINYLEAKFANYAGANAQSFMIEYNNILYPNGTSEQTRVNVANGYVQVCTPPDGGPHILNVLQVLNGPVSLNYHSGSGTAMYLSAFYIKFIN